MLVMAESFRCSLALDGAALQLTAFDKGIHELHDLPPLLSGEPRDQLQPTLHAGIDRLALALGGLGAEQRLHRDTQHARQGGQQRGWRERRGAFVVGHHALGDPDLAGERGLSQFGLFTQLRQSRTEATGGLSCNPLGHGNLGGVHGVAPTIYTRSVLYSERKKGPYIVPGPLTTFWETRPMARIPDEELERLKSEVSLTRLMAQGLTLTSQGKDLACRCPWHEGDDTPSCIVTPATNLWHCFGCDAGGTVIDWVMRSQRVSFRHACDLLMKAHPALAAGSAATPAPKLSPGKLRSVQSFALPEGALVPGETRLGLDGADRAL